MIYRYAHDKSGQTFTESQWIERAAPRFIVALHDTRGSFLAFLTHTFDDHLNRGTIVPAHELEDGPVLAQSDIGCPACHHIHSTDKYGWTYPHAGHPAYYSAFGGWNTQ